MADSDFLAVHSGHNASAALMMNGRIIAAVQEERFSKKKNYVGYPHDSIEFCLKEGGVAGKDLARIAFTTIKSNGLQIKAKASTQFSLRDYHDYYGAHYFGKVINGENVLEYLQWLRDDPKFNVDKQYMDFSYLTDEVLKNPALESKLFRQEQVRTLSRQLRVGPERIEHLDHHTCHAAYAYFASPFRGKDCIIVTLDGWGDDRNQTVWLVRNDRPEIIAESPQNDIGRVYKMATLILGMRPDEHEFKVMGMAPYAKESYVLKAFQPISKLSRIDGM
jgi:carbamoyltransferase